MKKPLRVICLIITSCICLSCQAQQNVNNIDSETVHEMMINQQDFILVDVREEDEYNEGHIPQSELIPLGIIETDFEARVSDKNAEIVVYCRTGRRSHEACLKIMNLGYENVYDLGGIQDWKYEIER